MPPQSRITSQAWDMSSIAALFPPHSAFKVGACSSQYPILLAFSLFPSLNPAQTAGLSMVLSV